MSTTVRVSANKDVRREARILNELGFTYTRHDSRTHPVFTHPQHGEITLPDTPSGPGWLRHHRRRLAALLGMTVMTLEARIAGQARVGKRSGRQRSRRPKQQRRHLGIAPEVACAPPKPAAPAAVAESEPVEVVEFAPTDPITPARRQHWLRAAGERDAANLAQPFPWRKAA